MTPLRAIAVAAPAFAAGVALAFVGACGAEVRLGDLFADADADAGADVGLAPGASAESGSSISLDAGADADADAGSAGGFDASGIGTIAGLVLWLDGDRDVSRPPGGFRWGDQSGHGNDAIAPALIPPSTSSGFNGHAAIAFDSTQFLTVADGPTLRFSADYAVLVLARSETPPSAYGALFGKPATAYPFPGPGMYVNYPPLSGTRSSTVGAQIDFTNFIESAQAGVSDGVARIFEMQRRGDILSVRVNANAPTSVAVPPTDATAPGIDVFLGGNPGSPIQGLTGAIAEVLAINGTLAAVDEDLIVAYLTEKYALR